MKKAYGYLRVSGKDQIDGDGFPRQREAITTWATANGYTAVEFFEERGVTGKAEHTEREAWTRMLTDMLRNGVKTILIEKLDRLARDLMVQEHIIADLRREGLTLISAAEPDLCVDDPSRKLLRQIMGAIAEYDRAMITAKLAAARKRMKAITGRCEGRKPYGERPGEPETLALVARERADGNSFAKIAAHLNETGVPTRTAGKKWSGQGLRTIMEGASK